MTLLECLTVLNVLACVVLCWHRHSERRIARLECAVSGIFDIFSLIVVRPDTPRPEVKAGKPTLVVNRAPDEAV